MKLTTAVMQELFERVEAGNEHIDAIAFIETGWTLVVTAGYRITDKMRKDRREEYSFVTDKALKKAVKIAVVAEPNDAELAEIAEFIRQVCEEFHFQTRKGYQYGSSHHKVVYYLKPDWNYYERKRVTPRLNEG